MQGIAERVSKGVRLPRSSWLTLRLITDHAEESEGAARKRKRITVCKVEDTGAVRRASIVLPRYVLPAHFRRRS